MKRSLIVIYFIFFTITSLLAQDITVQGFVRNVDDAKIIDGVSVRSTKSGKILGKTNSTGYFKVNTTKDDVLEFSSVGYSRETVSLASKTIYTLNVYLKIVENVITDVVVQGFAQRSRQTLTGSSVTINGDDLQNNPVSNFTELLQGRVAGLNVQMNNGAPGVRGSVMIRGLNSVAVTGSGSDAFLTPTSPMYIVDGVQVDDNTSFDYGFASGGTGISPLSLIPAEDIESVSILKDAAATALYGSRGAYGVIIITTKRGNSSVPIIAYSTNQFLSVPPKLRDVLGGRDERMFRIGQVMQYSNDPWAGRDDINNRQILTDSLNPYFNNSTNWQDIFYKTQYNQTHNLSASGGNTVFNYKVNGNYTNEKGIIQNTGFKRYVLRMNSQYRPNDNFKLFASMSGNMGEQKTGSGSAIAQGGVASQSSATSLLPSPYQGFVNGGLVNALDGRNDNRTTDLSSSVDLEYGFLNGFRLRNNFTYNYVTNRTDTYKPSISNNNISELYNFDEQRNTVNNLIQLSYLKVLDEKHTFNTYIFNEIILRDRLVKMSTKSGFANDQLEGPVGFAKSNGGVTGLEDFRSAAFGGTFSYNYDMKYVFDFSYRLDKSSSTGPDKPWRQNPALSARWNLSREGFMERTKSWMNELSIRGSWGRNIVPTGSVFDSYGKYVYDGFFNNQPIVELDWNLMANSSLVPSTTTSMSFAIEGTFLDNKITTTQEVYYKQVDNGLFSQQLANHNVFSILNTNDVAHVTYGYEYTIGFRPFVQTQGKGVGVRFDLNGAINKDILTRLPGVERERMIRDNAQGLHQLYRLGRNNFSHVLLDYKGVYKTDADVPVNPATGERLRTANGVYFQGGDPIWTDLNGDYIINDNDLVVIGNSQPLINGGFQTLLQYNRWSLSMNFSYIFDRDIINASFANQLNSYKDPLMTASNGRGSAALLPYDVYDFWLNDGDESEYPNPFNYLRQSRLDPFRANQTLFMEDGSYLKFNSATFTYNFNRDFLKRYNFRSARIYLTANNIYTFSKYSGMNPETVTDMGYDRTDGYPNRRSYVVGFSFEF